MIDPLGRSRHPYRIPRAMSRLAAVAGAVGFLGGCGTLGSGTIVTARTPVNEAVATTSRQQTLMNIVRVYHNEAPVILDIVEADEAVSVSGQAMGGVTNVGSIASGSLAGQIGSANATVGAGDAVTNRYVPLQGQALINQLVSPITVETVNALYDSNWPLQSVLDFAFDRITPNLDDFRLAVDLMTDLDSREAISLATAKSGFSKDDPVAKRLKVGNVTINTQAASAGGGDTLNIYKAPTSGLGSKLTKAPDDEVWRRLASLYTGSQPDQAGRPLPDKNSAPLIELRNSPRTHLDGIDLSHPKHMYFGPVARTRTAIGILKYLVTQPKIALIPLKDYQEITRLPWNSEDKAKKCNGADYYVLNPEALPPSQAKDKEFAFDLLTEKDYTKNRDKVIAFLGFLAENNTVCPFDYVAHPRESFKDDKDLASFAIALGYLERNILIVTSEEAVAGAQIAWSDGSMHYSIMGDDFISQRNLTLVSQFLSIQATSTPAPSLTTISPSGR